METHKVCPFSKSIIGQWYHCRYARLADRCSGKMICYADDETMRSCLSLDQLLQQCSRFVVGPSTDETALTHAQLMKIRCGGLQGMERVLQYDHDGRPAIPLLISAAQQRYGTLQSFPYDQIIQDIRHFNMRRRTSVAGDQIV